MPMTDEDVLGFIGDYSTPYISDAAECLRAVIARAERAEVLLRRLTECSLSEANKAYLESNGYRCGESCRGCQNAAELEKSDARIRPDVPRPEDHTEP